MDGQPINEQPTDQQPSPPYSTQPTQPMPQAPARQSRNMLLIRAGVAVVVIAIVAYFLLASPHAAVQKGSTSSPYNASQGYQGAGYYNINGQNLYISSHSQLNSSLTQISTTSAANSTTLQSGYYLLTLYNNCGGCGSTSPNSSYSGNNYKYSNGTTVNLNEYPFQGYAGLGWSSTPGSATGPCASTPSCSIVITSNTTEYASFATSTSTTTSTTTSSSTSTSVGGGTGNYYMSQAEAATLLGSGGSYNVTKQNQSQIQSSHSVPSNFEVTEVYSMDYSIPYSGVSELVFATQNKTGVYKTLRASYAQTFFDQTYLQNEGATNIQIVNNATTNGLTYTYASYTTPASSQNAYDILLVGEKNNEVVYATISTTTTHPEASSVASIIAQDLP